LKKRDHEAEQALRVLIADDSRDAIAQIGSWIHERWPSAELFDACTPEEAIDMAMARKIENLVLDLDFGAQRASGVVIARTIREARRMEKTLSTRIVFRTVHAGDAGYLRQIEKLITDDRHRPTVWGFLDKGSVPKRVAQNAIEQVFLYELCFSDIFNQRLKESPSRDLTDLEFTALIYIAVGATNDGIGWIIGASRQSVERIVGGLYQKMKIVSRGRAPQGVPALLESRTRLCCEAMTRGLINANLLREEDAGLRRTVRTSGPAASRLYVNRDWLDLESEVRGRET